MAERRKPPPPAEPLQMHGAKLPASMVYKVRQLHAETGKTKQQLHTEAYELLFAHYEAQGVIKPTAAEIAQRTLTGEGGTA